MLRLCSYNTGKKFLSSANFLISPVSNSMNNITSLPADFGHDLPALRFLDLQSNYITTVDEESLAPLNTNTTDAIELGGKPPLSRKNKSISSSVRSSRY